MKCVMFFPGISSKKLSLAIIQFIDREEGRKQLNQGGYYRNITFTMDDETAASYIDTDLNFVFRDIYLEESEIIPQGKQRPKPRSPVFTWKEF